MITLDRQDLQEISLIIQKLEELQAELFCTTLGDFIVWSDGTELGTVNSRCEFVPWNNDEKV